VVVGWLYGCGFGSFGCGVSCRCSFVVVDLIAVSDVVVEVCACGFSYACSWGLLVVDGVVVLILIFQLMLILTLILKLILIIDIDIDGCTYSVVIWCSYSQPIGS
jgi:hypothetical protein